MSPQLSFLAWTAKQKTDSDLLTHNTILALQNWRSSKESLRKHYKRLLGYQQPKNGAQKIQHFNIKLNNDSMILLMGEANS